MIRFFCFLMLWFLSGLAGVEAAWAQEGLTRQSGVFRGDPYVVDGDSLTFQGIEVRLLCLDAVELHQSCQDEKDAPYPCGVKAREAMASLIGKKAVSCVGRALDAYDRPLVFCRVGTVDLSRAMVTEGWAVGTCRETKKLAQQAKALKKGMWKGTFLRPSTWRKNNPRTSP